MLAPKLFCPTSVFLNIPYPYVSAAQQTISSHGHRTVLKRPHLSLLCFHGTWHCGKKQAWHTAHFSDTAFLFSVPLLSTVPDASDKKIHSQAHAGLPPVWNRMASWESRNQNQTGPDSVSLYAPDVPLHWNVSYFPQFGPVLPTQIHTLRPDSGQQNGKSPVSGGSEYSVFVILHHNWIWFSFAFSSGF